MLLPFCDSSASLRPAASKTGRRRARASPGPRSDRRAVQGIRETSAETPRRKAIRPRLCRALASAKISYRGSSSRGLEANTPARRQRVGATPASCPPPRTGRRRSASGKVVEIALPIVLPIDRDHLAGHWRARESAAGSGVSGGGEKSSCCGGCAMPGSASRIARLARALPIALDIEFTLPATECLTGPGGGSSGRTPHVSFRISHAPFSVGEQSLRPRAPIHRNL